MQSLHKSAIVTLPGLVLLHLSPLSPHSCQGVCVANSQRCVIKILKPVKKKKIRREIKILQVWGVSPVVQACLGEGGGVQGVRVFGGGVHQLQQLATSTGRLLSA